MVDFGVRRDRGDGVLERGNDWRLRVLRQRILDGVLLALLLPREPPLLFPLLDLRSRRLLDCRYLNGDLRDSDGRRGRRGRKDDLVGVDVAEEGIHFGLRWVVRESGSCSVDWSRGGRTREKKGESGGSFERMWRTEGFSSRWEETLERGRRKREVQSREL